METAMRQWPSTPARPPSNLFLLKLDQGMPVFVSVSPLQVSRVHDPTVEGIMATQHRLSSEEPAMLGYLVKQGKTVKNWKRRWFVLQGSQLTYAKDTVRFLGKS